MTRYEKTLDKSRGKVTGESFTQSKKCKNQTWAISP